MLFSYFLVEYKKKSRCEEEMKLKMPYDISNYEKIIKDEYYYVNKNIR